MKGIKASFIHRLFLVIFFS